MKLEQLEIKTAFLLGDLDKKIFIAQHNLESFEVKRKSNRLFAQKISLSFEAVTKVIV